ncbi:MAG: peptidylprolyl isomerase [Lachnospiraceae bacterium]|nr:peptidylprolyl isomerase [Lachnospiraceae bacterium]
MHGICWKNRRGRALLLVTMLLLCCLLSACGKKKKKTDTETNATPSVTATPTAIPYGPKEAALSDEAKTIYQFETPKSGDIVVKINVKKYGTICIKLFPNEAPKAVENFTTLATQGCYENVKFARIIADYLVQSATAQGYTSSIYGGGFEVETSDKLRPVRGALCMADASEDGTNTSSFYIVVTKGNLLRSLSDPLDARYQITFADYLEEAYNTKLSEEQLDFYYTYGGAPWLYGHQTVFGQVYDGFDVLDALSEAKVTSKCVPNPGIFIESVTVETIP